MQKGRAIPNLVKYLRVVYDSELLLHECTVQLSTRLLSGWSNQLNLIMTVCLSLLSPPRLSELISGPGRDLIKITRSQLSSLQVSAAAAGPGKYQIQHFNKNLLRI